MNNINLMRDGSIVQNGETVESVLLMFLGFKVDLEKGYTLRSWFQMLGKYSLLASLNAFLPTSIEQYLACPANGCCFDGFDHLEFNKTVEMIGFPGNPRLEIYNSFHGIKSHKTFALKSVRMENILDMSVRLGKLKHVVFGDKVDIFEFDTVFSLFEFIDGIAWELSFHGSPKQCEIGR